METRIYCSQNCYNKDNGYNGKIVADERYRQRAIDQRSAFEKGAMQYRGHIASENQGNTIGIGYIAIPPKVSFKDIFETNTIEEFKEKLASYIESSFDN